MNIIKNIFWTLGTLISVSILIMLGLSYYISLPSIQTKIEEEFKNLAAIHNISLDKLSIKSSKWGGIVNPFSIQIKQVITYYQTYTLRIQQLKLGISPLSLLQLSPKLKHIKIQQAHLQDQERIILEFDGTLSLNGSIMSYDLKNLNCRLKDLAPLHPDFAKLQTLDLPLKIQSSGSYDGNNGIKGYIQTIIDRGTFTLPPYYPEKIEIHGGTIEGQLAPEKLNLTISKIKSPDVIINANCTVESESLMQSMKTEIPLHLKLSGNLENLPVDQVKIYWPVGLGKKARAWVTENLSKGIIPKATIELTGQLLIEQFPKFNIDSLTGIINATGVDVAYLGNLPKVTNTSGHCIYSKNNFLIDAHGQCDGMMVESAHLDLYQLDTDDEAIKINLKIQGPLEEALNLISQKPLELTQKLGLDHTLFAGHAATHLHLNFPLKSDLPLEAVTADATSKISNAKLNYKKISQLIPEPLTQGEFDLHVDNDHLILNGTGQVAGHSATITASKSFLKNEKILKIDASDLGNDPNLGKFLIDYNNDKLFIQADLSKLETSFPAINFAKHKNTPGSLKLSGVISNDTTMSISDLNLNLGNAVIVAKGTLKNSALDLDLHRVDIGTLNSKLKIKGTTEKINIEGTIKTFDLDLLFKHLDKGSQKILPDIKAYLTIDKFLLGPKMDFGAIKTSFTWTDNKISSLVLTSLQPGKLEIHLGPLKNNQHAASLSCENAGDLIDYFAPNNDFEGGQVHFSGFVRDVNNTYQLDGEVDLRNVTAIKAPILAQILSISSLDGIIRTLSGQGIHFDHTAGRIRWQDHKFYLDDIHASGSAIALNLDGYIDSQNKSCNLQGELYPLNSLNLVMANIPLLGSILSGGKNRGIFSTPFTVSGNLDSPKISVNPLSTIAPQAMKELMKGSPAKQQALPEPQ